MTIYSGRGSGRSISPRTLLLQLLATLPFFAIMTANFVMTAVPDYQPLGFEIQIDSVFPSDRLKDRDNRITGTRGDAQYRFRCHPAVELDVGARVPLLADRSQAHVSVPGCAAAERQAADRARWSAWVFVSFVLFYVLYRLSRMAAPQKPVRAIAPDPAPARRAACN